MYIMRENKKMLIKYNKDVSKKKFSKNNSLFLLMD